MKLVTLISETPGDAGKLDLLVQINDSDAIGDPNVSGQNARHQVKVGDDVAMFLAAVYPGAEIHTVDTLNAKVADTLVAKGLRVKLDGGELVTPEERDRRVAEAKAIADAAAERERLAKEADQPVEAAVADVAAKG